MALHTFSTGAPSAPGGADGERARLTRHLVESGKLSPDALTRAEQISAESNERIEVVLTRLGLIGERDLAEAFATVLKLPLVAATQFPQSPILEDKLKRKFLRDSHVVPLEERPEGLAIAIANPLDSYTIEAIRFAAGRAIIVHVAYPADLEAAQQRLYGEGKSQIREIFEETKGRNDDNLGDDVDRLKDIASDAPVVRLVNLLINRAVELRASDIHIEPMENELRVRYRIDGVLQPVESPPQRLASAIVSRVKIMAKLNIAERRLAQDGRIGLAVRGRDIDFRVSTVPTVFGESVVLRILDREHLDLNFERLGFESDLVERFRRLLSQPHGIVLVTGPTGSGKTTTLYTALTELSTPDRKVLTIEDPVEYQLGGVNQVQVKPQIGLSFASALRSFLRQDPDIMMVGEIRDLETAEIAVQAALTGHLILSTLHTNDAASAVTRLLDMGVEDYLLTSTINGVAAQRLVRTLCPNCREPYEPIPELIEKLGLARLSDRQPLQLHRAVGCDNCNHSGYRGRSAIVEVLNVDDHIRQAILKNADSGAIEKLACEAGMQTMYMHGLRKALAGVTTIEDVMRVTRTQ
jgi:general secretion pathway protein E